MFNTLRCLLNILNFINYIYSFLVATSFGHTLANIRQHFLLERPLHSTICFLCPQAQCCFCYQVSFIGYLHPIFLAAPIAHSIETPVLPFTHPNINPCHRHPNSYPLTLLSTHPSSTSHVPKHSPVQITVHSIIQTQQNQAPNFLYTHCPSTYRHTHNSVHPALNHCKKSAELLRFSWV